MVLVEERGISVDIGCTGMRQGKEAGREVAGRLKGEQSRPPKHVSRYACTLQLWGCRPGAAVGKERRKVAASGHHSRRLLCPARRGGSGRSCKVLDKCAASPELQSSR